MSTKILPVIFKIFAITISIIWKYPRLSSSQGWRLACSKISKSGYQNRDSEMECCEGISLYCLKTMFRMYIKLPNWSYIFCWFLSVIFKIFTITISIIWRYPTLVIARALKADLACPKFSKFGISKWRLRNNFANNLLYIA